MYRANPGLWAVGLVAFAFGSVVGREGQDTPVRELRWGYPIRS